MSITLSADTFTQMTNDINADRAKIRELEKENKELKAELKKFEYKNEQLIEELQEWIDAAEDTNAETPSELSTWIEASIHEDDEIYSKYMEPLELREENKELKKAIQSAYEIVPVDTLKKIEELKEEYKKLQEELKLAKGGFKLLECVDCKCIILDDLQGQINKLKEELEKSKTDALCFSAQLNFAGEYSDIEDYSQFNEWIKENYTEDEYKKMYEWYDMEDYIEEE